MELGGLIGALIVLAIFFVILRLVIRSAVREGTRNALNDHYKTARWFAETDEWWDGEWREGPPRDTAAGPVNRRK